MYQYLVVACGGGIGAVLRLGLIRLTAPLEQWALHTGVISANLLGCLLIGLLWVWAERYAFGVRWKAFVFTGIIGSLTTFSTFAILSAELALGEHLMGAFLYVMCSTLGGLLFVYFGMEAGRRFSSSEVHS